MEPQDVDALIRLLKDPTARLDERDDAAIDLGKSDQAAALDALLEVGLDPREDDMILASVGESIGQIAVRTGTFDGSWEKQLAPAAAREMTDLIRAERPDLIVS